MPAFIPAKEHVKDLKICWIGAVCPSRQLLRSFLGMRSFLHAVKDFLILRRPQGGRLEGRTIAMQPRSSILSQAGKRGSRATAEDWTPTPGLSLATVESRRNPGAAFERVKTSRQCSDLIVTAAAGRGPSIRGTNP